jgi:hypothetical protein
VSPTQAAVNAHFVPWSHVQTALTGFPALPAEFSQAVEQFLADYSRLRTTWQAQPPEIASGCYPLPIELPGRFGVTWHGFKVTGAATENVRPYFGHLNLPVFARCGRPGYLDCGDRSCVHNYQRAGPRGGSQGSVLPDSIGTPRPGPRLTTGTVAAPAVRCRCFFHARRD